MSDLVPFPRPAGHRRGRRRRSAAERAVYAQVRTVAAVPAVVFGVLLGVGWALWLPTGLSVGGLLTALSCSGVVVVLLGFLQAQAASDAVCQSQAQQAEQLIAAVKSVSAVIARTAEELRHGGRPCVPETPPGNPGGDSFADVEDALAWLQSKAARTVVQAHEQSQLAVRHAMFRHIARREHTLVSRALAALTDLQDLIEDAVLLDKVFQVDHLVTRLRRLVESVAVLGGESARSVRQPVTVVNVLRGAVQEIEQYPRARVATHPYNATLALPGHVGPDVTHLVAELIENAAEFSDPSTQVQLRAELVATGLAIEVHDRALPMPPQMRAQMNQLLAAPEAVDVSAQLEDGRIGLLVAALIAQRHGIDVQLHPNAAGGTTAVVVIPSRLLVEVPEPGPVREPAGQPLPPGPPGPIPQDDTPPSPQSAAVPSVPSGLPQRRRPSAPTPVQQEIQQPGRPGLPVRPPARLPIPGQDTGDTGPSAAPNPGLAGAFLGGSQRAAQENTPPSRHVPDQ
ncbi:MAG: ATP-binding protein [Streptomycetaceae bacterium]|nr:ATP-binding protein [Streptomycetaceae bacterium]